MYCNISRFTLLRDRDRIWVVCSVIYGWTHSRPAAQLAPVPQNNRTTGVLDLLTTAATFISGSSILLLVIRHKSHSCMTIVLLPIFENHKHNSFKNSLKSLFKSKCFLHWDKYEINIWLYFAELVIVETQKMLQQYDL